jgi:hypothetical protein
MMVAGLWLQVTGYRLQVAVPECKLQFLNDEFKG